MRPACHCFPWVKHTAAGPSQVDSEIFTKQPRLPGLHLLTVLLQLFSGLLLQGPELQQVCLEAVRGFLGQTLLRSLWAEAEGTEA